ncbi:MAG: signal peptidase II [Clostridium sp.]|nr:signal peptidase II [Clostridium sp.]MCM1547598.1 signal peptidase II [Ruminococcus sp.]
MIIAFVSVAVLTGADQLIKLWVVNNLNAGEYMKFIGIRNLDVIDLTYVENDGAIFGKFSGMRWMLIAVTVLLIAFCVFYMIKHKSEKMLVVCLTLIVGGGLGNLIDRLFRNGIVVDYLDLQLFDFAVFNFADCCVTVGAALLLIYILFFDKSDKKTAAEKNE